MFIFSMALGQHQEEFSEFYDCAPESEVIASSFCDNNRPSNVIYNELVDLNINNLNTGLVENGVELSDVDFETLDIFEKSRSSNLKNYWQSSGQQPHEIIFRFSSPRFISKIELWVDQVSDTSYCPQIIIVSTQHYYHSFTECQTLKVNKIPREAMDHKLIYSQHTFDLDIEHVPLKEITALKLQIAANFDSGLEVRLHAVRLWSPKQYPLLGGFSSNQVRNQLRFR